MTEAAEDIQITPYVLLGGDEGVRRLAKAFYAAMDRLPEAKTIREMHKDNLDEIEEKLYEFLSGWLGGPHHYFNKYGTVCLTKPHRPYVIGEAERDQWLQCMDEALDEVGAPDELKAMLKKPFFTIANMMRTQ